MDLKNELGHLLEGIEFAEKQRVIEAVETILSGPKGEERVSQLMQEISAKIEANMPAQEVIDLVLSFVGRVEEVVSEEKAVKDDFYSTEVLTVWAKDFGAEKIRKKSTGSMDIIKIRNEEISFAGFLNRITNKKNIKISVAREYLALLAEGNTNEEIEKIIGNMTGHFYSFSDLHNFAKETGAKKIREISTANKNIFLLNGKKTSYNSIFKAVAKRKNIKLLEAREYLALFAEGYSEKEVLEKIEEIEENRKNRESINFYSSKVLRIWAKTWGAKKIRATKTVDLEAIILEEGGVSEPTIFRALVDKIRRVKNFNGLGEAREYLALLAEDYLEEKILEKISEARSKKGVRNKIEREKIKISSLEIFRGWAKSLGAEKIRKISTGSEEEVCFHVEGEEKKAPFRIVIGKVRRLKNIIDSDAREALALLAEDFSEKEIDTNMKERRGLYGIDFYSKEVLYVFAKEWGADKIRKTFTTSQTEVILSAKGKTIRTSFNLILAKLRRSKKLSMTEARENLALLAENFSEEEIETKNEEKQDIKKIDFYTTDVLRVFAKELGADMIRKIPIKSRKKLILHSKGKQKRDSFCSLVMTLGYLKNIRESEVKEFLALLAEDFSEEEINTRLQERQVLYETNFYTKDIIQAFAKSWGADKIRNTLVRSKEKEVVLFSGEKKLNLSFASFIAKIGNDKKIWKAEAREYLALLAEDYSEENAMEIIRKISDHRKAEEEQKESNKENLEDLKNLIEDINEGTGINAENIQKLVGIFGVEHLLEILYMHDPKYKGIPVEQARKIIAENIGEFWVNKNPTISDIEAVVLPKMLPPTLKQTLVSVLKADALSFYNQQKKSGSTENDADIILNYLMEKDEIFGGLEYEYLEEVMHESLEYYVSLFDQLKKPDYIVDTLKNGRLFPDINQLINVQETKDKGRMLIADEMGMGKSASAIMTKEMLGLDTALVVVPSNVSSTWENYLSDRVKENGDQVGYFKPGYAPKVLTVENVQDLQSEDIASYDYVILSLSRLNEAHLKELQELPFDHLIIDEVHKVKNVENGTWAKTALNLADKIQGEGKYLTLLSGTPIPNKVKDIAILLKLLHPDKFRDADPKALVRQIIDGDVLNLRALLADTMQMKELQESMELPTLKEETIDIELSGKEADLYRALLEEDELTPIEKITLFRKFLINPSSIDLTPNIEGAKIKRINEELDTFFPEKTKLIAFTNDYVDEILVGENSLVEKLNIPADVNLYVIHGGVNTEKRKDIQRRLNETDEKMMILVSGKTADVGVDYTGAQEVWNINQPWTKFDERQQIGRVYRPGLNHDLTVKTFLVQGSLEEAIKIYIEDKQRVINKLLKGLPLSEEEKDALLYDETIPDKDVGINPELAKAYLSYTAQLNKMFANNKKQGEKHFIEFMHTKEQGKMYAECYQELGRRSYEANNARVSGVLLKKMIEEQQQDPEALNILDLASGPEMLRKHSHESIQKRIKSVDINPHHFNDADSENVLIGSYLDIPREDNSIDYCNFGLAFHHAKLHFGHEEYEPLQILMEMNRVLKTGGRTIISFIHSMKLKDPEGFNELIKTLGFKLVKNYSGMATEQGVYEGEFITLEKIKDTPIEDPENFDIGKFVDEIGRDSVNTLHLKNKGKNEKNTVIKKDIITSFEFNQEKFDIQFNEEDQAVFLEEQEVIQVGKDLKQQYGKIHNIPIEEIIKNDLSTYRVKPGEYHLFKKLKGQNGSIIMK